MTEKGHKYFFGQMNLPEGYFFPEVAVIISNYNKKKFIKEAVGSVLNQTYQKFKIIVIDDTNGKDKLKELFEGKSNVTVYETNDIGLSALRMYGVEKTNTKYVLFLDADDKLHPLFLEKTVKLLDENPSISFAYTDTQHFDGADSYWEQPEYNFFALLQNNYICSCSLIRRRDLLASGGFDLDNFNYWEDYENWISMGSKGFYGKHIPEKLFYYRIHRESGTQSPRDRILAPLYKAYIINKFSEVYPREMKLEAERILKQYPPDIMKWKPVEQENYLKEKGLMKTGNIE